MGFSRVMVFGAHHWAEESVAAAEMAEAFRAEQPLPNLRAESRDALERIIAAFFCPSFDETLTMHFDLFSPAIQKVVALFLSAFARLLLERDGADAGTRR